MEAPAHSRSSVSLYANTVKPPTAGGPQGGEGLADPAVLRLLEIVRQDSFLVLQLLYENNTGACKKCKRENVKFTMEIEIQNTFHMQKAEHKH